MKTENLSEKASDAMNKILKSTTKVVDDINQVATASEEQSSTAQQIMQNIELMSNVTSESSLGAQQVANAIEELNKMTENLKVLLSQFNLIDNSEIKELALSKKSFSFIEY